MLQLTVHRKEGFNDMFHTTAPGNKFVHGFETSKHYSGGGTNDLFLPNISKKLSSVKAEAFALLPASPAPCRGKDVVRGLGVSQARCVYEMCL